MSSSQNEVYAFGRFRLDTRQRLLFDGQELVDLPPKAFETLLVLVENRGTVLSKEKLMGTVWANEFVEENNLAQNISRIRRALGDGTTGGRFIETIPKRGYRFVPDVEVKTERSATASLTRPATPTPTPQTHYATSTGDVNIAYQVVGDGPIDLVFVMGWVSHLEYFWVEPSFARFLTRLASFSRLILFDKRGTGLSDRVPIHELPTLEQRMTDVHAVMDAVGSQQAAFLGISEGGPMCSLFAATHPDRTLALTMIGTYAKRIRSADYPWAPTQEIRNRFLEQIKKEWGGPVGLAERAPSMVHDPQFSEWWATYLRMGASPAAAAALTQMNAEIDVRNVLPSLRVPTLVIHRRNDACLPVEGGRYVASLIPGAKYVELEGDDHLPFVGDQEAILGEIEQFIVAAAPRRQIDRLLTTVLFVLGEGLQQTRTRQHLALFKGKEIELTNERLFATFDGPARAIRCALALVDSGSQRSLPVRAGVHTGECDVQADRVTGTSVQVGEALAKHAASGNVLISHTVKDLVAGSGIGFEPHGMHTFRELSGEWALFAARSPQT